MTKQVSIAVQWTFCWHRRCTARSWTHIDLIEISSDEIYSIEDESSESRMHSSSYPHIDGKYDLLILIRTIYCQDTARDLSDNDLIFRCFGPSRLENALELK